MAILRLKLVLLGHQHVGKTSIANRYTKNIFSNRYIYTIGCDFFIKNLTCCEQEIKLIIHDIGGQVEFRDLRYRYMKNADIVFIVYDLNSEASFDIEAFIEDSKSLETNPLIVIVGNKLDLVFLEKINQDKIKEIAARENLKIFYTSAKQNIGIKELFSESIKMFLERNE
ncbi:MAG: Rab family GTPase [Promethearchaeota archaeon]